jgi:hypothetical protein
MDGYISFIRFADGFFGTSVPHEGECTPVNIDWNLVANSELICHTESIRVNEDKTCAMFTVTKTTKKKVKPQVVSEDAISAIANAMSKSPAVTKKKPVTAITSPLLQAFQKRDASKMLGGDAAQPIDVSDSATVVNTLQVRKKRKIAPTLVTMPAQENQDPIDLTETKNASPSKPPPSPVAAVAAPGSIFVE